MYLEGLRIATTNLSQGSERPNTYSNPCSMYCLCVNVYCHRVTTQLQLTNISKYIKIYQKCQIQV